MTVQEAKMHIDRLLEDLEKEYNSAHLPLTRYANYEYLQGQLYFIIGLFHDGDNMDEFVEIADYRREDRDDISWRFNKNHINPLYAKLKTLENITWR